LVEVVPQSHRGVLGLINRRKYAVCIATKPDEDDEDDNNDNNKGNNKEKKGEDESGKKSDYRDELPYAQASLTERRRLF